MARAHEATLALRSVPGWARWAMLAALVAGAGGIAVRSRTYDAAPPSDPLQARVLNELEVFTDWLAEHDVKGFIGEVGWPDDATGDAREWNALAERWFRRADAAKLWVTAWATGEWWGTGYNLAVYEDRTSPAGVDAANSQAEILERHLHVRGTWRGVNVAGAEFAAPSTEPTSGFSNATPGVYDVAYHYDGPETFEYLASRGIGLVRIPFRWERLQPRPGGRLDAREAARLTAAVGRAGAAGLRVVLDMHNYGAYYLSDGAQGVRTPIGSPGCTIRDFADVWRRISRRFAGDRTVVGYGLMNEPVDLRPQEGLDPAGVWRKASQRALRAIRANGDATVVLVAGYQWSGVQRWDDNNPRPWIRDPLDRFRYEAHHYWDRDNSGDYPDRYEDEVRAAERRASHSLARDA